MRYNAKWAMAFHVHKTPPPKCSTCCVSSKGRSGAQSVTRRCSAGARVRRQNKGTNTIRAREALIKRRRQEIATFMRHDAATLPACARRVRSPTVYAHAIRQRVCAAERCRHTGASGRRRPYARHAGTRRTGMSRKCPVKWKAYKTFEWWWMETITRPTGNAVLRLSPVHAL